MANVFNILNRLIFVLFSILLLSTLVLWVRSYWIVDEVSWLDSSSFRYGLATNSGRFELSKDKMFWGHSGHGLDYSTGAPSKATNVEWSCCGLAKSHFGNSFTVDIDVYSAPIAYFALFFALCMFLKIRAARCRRRGDQYERRCPGCGYDTRATPDRCPECGKLLQDDSLPARELRKNGSA